MSFAPVDSPSPRPSRAARQARSLADAVVALRPAARDAVVRLVRTDLEAALPDGRRLPAPGGGPDVAEVASAAGAEDAAGDAALHRAQREAVAIREEHRTRWTDRGEWWRTPPGAVSERVAAVEADVAVLVAALATHVRLVLGAPSTLDDARDAAVSSLLLAVVLGHLRPQHGEGATRAVDDYLLLTASYDEYAPHPLTWQAMDLAPWSRDWRGLAPPLRSRVLNEVAGRVVRGTTQR